ncbi:hypothetical protein QFZ71_003587 [Streptomyces sp. V2I9]|nr:hypothetical protein [Streptomyces sp. V2I9]
MDEVDGDLEFSIRPTVPVYCGWTSDGVPQFLRGRPDIKPVRTEITRT